MLRFAIRHGLVRMVGRRAVPIMLAWDVAVMANRARQIPIVDRGLRRARGGAVGSAAAGSGPGGRSADRAGRRAARGAAPPATPPTATRRA